DDCLDSVAGGQTRDKTDQQQGGTHEAHRLSERLPLAQLKPADGVPEKRIGRGGLGLGIHQNSGANPAGCEEPAFTPVPATTLGVSGRRNVMNAQGLGPPRLASRSSAYKGGLGRPWPQDSSQFST